MKNYSTYMQWVMFFMILIVPTQISAHVKWFTPVLPNRSSIEEIMSPLFLSLLFCIALGLAIGYGSRTQVERHIFIQKFNKKLHSYDWLVPKLLQWGTAVTFMIQLVSTQSIFALEIDRNPLIAMFMFLIAMLLFIPIRFTIQLAGSLIGICFIERTIYYGVFHMLDYVFYISIALIFLTFKTKYAKWGSSILYLGTGFSLCWVAVEKWVYPNMAISIIEHYGVPTFGIQITAFVCIAAFIEFIVGYFLIVGILNRFLSFLLTCILLSTTLIFGLKEFNGHFMIHLILITFIIEGTSFYKPPIAMHRTVWEQMLFVSINFVLTVATMLVFHYRFA